MGMFSKNNPKWRIDLVVNSASKITQYAVQRLKEFPIYDNDLYDILYVTEDIQQAKRYLRLHYDFPLEYFNKPMVGE